MPRKDFRFCMDGRTLYNSVCRFPRMNWNVLLGIFVESPEPTRELAHKVGSVTH